jgi:NAD+ kinase
MKLKSFAILKNNSKPWTGIVAKKIIEFLKKANIKQTNPKSAQIIITIGGDGTLLYYKNFYKKPFLAIGTKKSWLAAATDQNYISYLKRILKKGFFLEKRAMISWFLNSKKMPDCLNELTIRNKEHRIVEFELKIKNKTYKFLGDGVIFSSPTGSTAYAYSCGGKELSPTSSKYEIVPIAPYRRKFKPLVLSKSTKSKLLIKTTCQTDAVVDGQIEYPLKNNTLIYVQLSKKYFEFVKAY